MHSDLLARLERDGVYPAHIRLTEDGAEIQTVETHCRETADYAREALEPVGLGQAAHLGGRLHDGKETDDFRRYLVDSVLGRPVHRGSVNHTFMGVRILLDHLCGAKTDPVSALAAQHIAFAVGSHHGLFDIVSPEGDNGFDHRRTKPDPVIEEGVRRFLERQDLPGLQAQLKEASREIAAVYGKISNKKDVPFCSHLLSRLLLSAVIEGDRRSTAEFETPRREKPIRADEALWSQCLAHLEEKLQVFEGTTQVQKGRGIFSDRCRDFADRPGGIYRLNMPTGAGKTLSSLRYALAHCKKWNKRHIFFVMPLLAIIDQNADVLRDYLGREDIVLEHHSNLLETDEEQELDRRELLTENWDAPVVITTLVQFLNTLFSHKTASIRRFHSLCSSVIIIDEVQTVPANLLSVFNQTIQFLAEVCGATVILCSATQPALEHAQRPLRPVPEDMVPYEETLWAPFRRTVLCPVPAMDLEQIGTFAAERLAEKDSLLVVCNTKIQAARLYEMLKNQEARCFHFSASMCMAHRRAVLAEMEAAKKQGKVLCISTQVMEAGVDISFQCVIRLMAGLDSVIQAAGRCNRSGESPMPEDVYVMACRGEDLRKLPEIEKGRDSCRELFAGDRADYSDAAAIEAYYRIFYRNQADRFQDCYCKTIRKTLYELLRGIPGRPGQKQVYFLNQAQKTAGLHFQVFDNDTVDAVVPYGDGAQRIQKLYEARDGKGMEKALADLKPYTVSLYRYRRESLEAQGALTAGPAGVLILGAPWYDEALGLVVRQNMTFLEV